MTFIARLRHSKLDNAQRLRVVGGLQRLRAAMHADGSPPERTSDSTLVLATWNLREFGKSKYGYRSEEPYYYIAEIISRFDVVAIQEVRSLYSLQQLANLLGPSWDYLVTDVTLGTSGNSERLAYLYDSRKIRFSGLAAEVVLPKSGDEGVIQFARSPYIAGFRAGWAQVNLCTVHIYYGAETPDDPRRVKEIRDLAQLLKKNVSQFRSGRAALDEQADIARNENLLLLGDFNIFNREDVTMKGLTDAGFVVPPGLDVIPGSNVAKNKHYDQIAYLEKTTGMYPTGRAGVFDFFTQVYRDQDEADYRSEMGATAKYKDWRTFQMSDHLPMWCEFRIDDMDAYLERLKREYTP